MPEQNCRTCIFASWAKTANGRRMPHAGGNCHAEPVIKIPKAKLPIGGQFHLRSEGYIWWDRPLTDCEFWAEEQRP
jgi:hypothetical protein